MYRVIKKARDNRIVGYFLVAMFLLIAISNLIVVFGIVVKWCN